MSNRRRNDPDHVIEHASSSIIHSGVKPPRRDLAAAPLDQSEQIESTPTTGTEQFSSAALICSSEAEHFGSSSAPEADSPNTQAIGTQGLRPCDSGSAPKAQLSDDAPSHSLASLVRDDPQLAFLHRHWASLSPHVREAAITLIAADLVQRGVRNG